MNKRILPALLVVFASTQIACMGGGGNQAAREEAPEIQEDVLDTPADAGSEVQLQVATSVVSADEAATAYDTFSTDEVTENPEVAAGEVSLGVPAIELNENNATGAVR
jgi:hypothetical protein